MEIGLFCKAKVIVLIGDGTVRVANPDRSLQGIILVTFRPGGAGALDEPVGEISLGIKESNGADGAGEGCQFWQREGVEIGVKGEGAIRQRALQQPAWRIINC